MAERWPPPRRQQDRRLHFKVVTRVHEAPDRRHQLAPQHEPRPHLVVGDQVRLALPEPLLHVLQPVPLLRRRPQRLAEHRRRPRLHRRLARPSVDEPPAHADEVAEVQRLQQLEVSAGEVAAQLRLHPTSPVAQVQERDAPHVPHARDATRHADHALPRRPSLLRPPRQQRQRLRDGVRPPVPRRERVDALLAKPLQLLGPHLEVSVAFRHDAPRFVSPLARSP